MVTLFVCSSTVLDDELHRVVTHSSPSYAGLLRPSECHHIYLNMEAIL